MNESLLSRIGRIVSASANSLVDSMENTAPSMVLEEAIREVEQATDEIRHELGRQEAARHLTSKQLIKENEEHEQLSEQIQVALQAQRNDLAEVAVARQMDIEAQIPVLERSIDDQKEQITELNQYIAALQAKKREMQQGLSELLKSQVAADQPNASGDNSRNTTSQRVNKAQSTFDRVMTKATGNPTRQNNADAVKLAELEELARNNRIQERLEQLKAAK